MTDEVVIQTLTDKVYFIDKEVERTGNNLADLIVCVDAEILVHALKLIHRQKAEIERLTKENELSKDMYVDIRKCNEILLIERTELQKQVDELTAKLQCPTDITEAVKPFVNEAVKDTVTEVYSAVLEFCPVHNDGSYSKFIGLLEEWLKHKYGVEVE